MTSEPVPEVKFGLGEALGYGLLQGPTELLPVSSSGHLVIAPWLLGSDYVTLDPELRKSFEVALHVGTAAALVVVLREEVLEALRELDARRLGVIGAGLVPPAIAALVAERFVERRLGEPRIVAAGLVAGSLGMLAADRCRGSRERAQADWRDGLALGVAQTFALIPGVSRSGSTLAAARARGFTPAAASELSMHAALPVIGGAALLKGARLARRGLPKPLRGAFAVGTAGSFVSSLAGAGLLAKRRRGRGLRKYVIYRLALAAVVASARPPARRLGSSA